MTERDTTRSNVVGLPPRRGGSGSGLPPGGRGPDDPDMETRVAGLGVSLGRIEAALEGISREVSRNNTDLGEFKREFSEFRKEQSKQGEALARLDGRVAGLPSTLQLLGFILAVLAVAGLTRVFAP